MFVFAHWICLRKNERKFHYCCALLSNDMNLNIALCCLSLMVVWWNLLCCVVSFVKNKIKILIDVKNCHLANEIASIFWSTFCGFHSAVCESELRKMKLMNKCEKEKQKIFKLHKLQGCNRVRFEKTNGMRRENHKFCKNDEKIPFRWTEQQHHARSVLDRHLSSSSKPYHEEEGSEPSTTADFINLPFLPPCVPVMWQLLLIIISILVTERETNYKN